MLRLAVISDLHATLHTGDAEATHPSFLQVAAPAIPKDQDAGHSLLHLIESEQLRVDALLVAGDLTNRAELRGLVWADIVSDRVASALQCARFMTLGNHDAESRNPSATDPFRRAKQVRLHFPAATAEAAKSFWASNYYIADQAGWRLVVLNTACEHSNPQAAERGSVPAATLDALRNDLAQRPPALVQVALMHHHPVIHSDIGLTMNDVMLNGDKVLETLASHGTGLVVHGHKHRPRICQFNNGGHPLTIVAAGSLSAALPADLGSNVRNLFHIIEIETPEAVGRPLRGRVRSWEYSFGIGWRQSTPRSAGLPHVSGFGALRSVTEIADEIALGFTGVSELWTNAMQRVPDADFLSPEACQELFTLLERDGIAVHLRRNDGSPSQLYREPQ